MTPAVSYEPIMHHAAILFQGRRRVSRVQRNPWDNRRRRYLQYASLQAPSFLYFNTINAVFLKYICIYVHINLMIGL